MQRDDTGLDDREKRSSSIVLDVSMFCSAKAPGVGDHCDLCDHSHYGHAVDKFTQVPRQHWPRRRVERFSSHLSRLDRASGEMRRTFPQTNRPA